MKYSHRRGLWLHFVEKHFLYDSHYRIRLWLAENSRGNASLRNSMLRSPATTLVLRL